MELEKSARRTNIPLPWARSMRPSVSSLSTARRTVPTALGGVAGFMVLGGGSTVAGPLLLVLGFAVLVPLGIIL